MIKRWPVLWPVLKVNAIVLLYCLFMVVYICYAVYAIVQDYRDLTSILDVPDGTGTSDGRQPAPVIQVRPRPHSIPKDQVADGTGAGAEASTVEPVPSASMSAGA